KIKLSICVLALLLICIGSATATYTAETVAQNSFGETVVRVQLRLRELDYLYFKPTGNFKGMTVNSVMQFQTREGLPVDGTAGEQTQTILFSARALRALIPDSTHIPIGPSYQSNHEIKGSIVVWDTIKSELIVGKSYRVMDYNTGKVFFMTYTGGTNHAEMECTSSKDMEIFLQVFGGVVNYSKRPVVIGVSGKDVAASLFGFPHGTDTITNNDMDGHTCMFFQGSVSHVGGIADVEHQRQIYAASGA
ncbi:MAG: peptidoglycan-binding protein, partial [Clostridiales bacterium]|nr:peptidoglycan-binding protein [Clostridiales bacterium]